MKDKLDETPMSYYKVAIVNNAISMKFSSPRFNEPYGNSTILDRMRVNFTRKDFFDCTPNNNRRNEIDFNMSFLVDDEGKRSMEYGTSRM